MPGLRHAKQLVEAIRERLGDGPKPQVIVNRFEQRLFSLRSAPHRHRAGARRLASADCIPNDYGLVREAIDRGVPLDEVKPGNKITAQLKKLILPQGNGRGCQPLRPTAGGKKFKLLARWRGYAQESREHGRPFYSSPHRCPGPRTGEKSRALDACRGR